MKTGSSSGHFNFLFGNVLIHEPKHQLSNHRANLESREARLVFLNFLDANMKNNSDMNKKLLTFHYSP